MIELPVSFQAHVATPEELFDVVSLVYASVDSIQPHERRTTERERAFMAVAIQYLDDSYQPYGDEVCGLTRDVSVGGLGILCHEAAPTKNALVTFPELGTDPILMKVTFCIGLGPFFHIGTSFCVDWT